MSTSDGAAKAHKRQHEIIGIQVGFTVFSAVVLALRLWSRILIQTMPMGADDWTIVVAWILSLVFAVDVCMQTRYGLGWHHYDLPAGTDTALQLKLYFIKEPIYYFAVSLTKVSILFLYLKLSPNRTFKRTVWGMIVFVMLTATTISIAGVFQCTPISKAWKTDEPGTCFQRIDMFVANAALNIAQDIIVYLMPIRMLWKLRMAQRQRIVLVLVFIMGGLVIVAGIARVPSLLRLGTSTDQQWDDFDAALWSSVEMNVGIVCASLVHFKALLTRYAPWVLGISGRTMYNASGDGLTGPPIRLPDYQEGISTNNTSRDLHTHGSGHPINSIGVLKETTIETKTISHEEAALNTGHYYPN